MRLTVQTDYALRMLMHLAVHDGRLSTISEIAIRYGISKNHLMKVAQSLSAWGFASSVRGRAGGLRLARPPSEISVGAVARLLEAGSALVECFTGGAGACFITPACKLKGILARRRSRFSKFSMATRLAIWSAAMLNCAIS